MQSIQKIDLTYYHDDSKGAYFLGGFGGHAPQEILEYEYCKIDVFKVIRHIINNKSVSFIQSYSLTQHTIISAICKVFGK